MLEKSMMLSSCQMLRNLTRFLLLTVGCLITGSLLMLGIGLAVPRPVAAAPALTPAGTAQAWGYNGYGQLGNGSTTQSNIPVNVSNLTNVTAVVGGTNHSVARLSTGVVRAWGYNNEGELGNGTNSPLISVPVQVSNLTNVTAVAAGSYFSLALKGDGTVWAWGVGTSGQLGNGLSTTSNIPVQVTNLTNITAISAGYFFSLALKSDGTVWAWGDNGNGQFGSGNYNSSNVPILITSSAITVSAGNSFSLIVKNDGTVVSSGANIYGQLGNGTTTNSNTFVTVSGLSGVQAVAGGASHSLALKTDGSVWSWGRNNAGELGNNSITNSSVPVQISGLRGVTKLAASTDYSLALKGDGTVWAWGYNSNGQLGNGGQTIGNCNCQIAPVVISGLSQIVDISAGSLHALAVGGTVNKPAFSPSPNRLDFGNQHTSQTSAGQSISISNSGPTPLVISGTTFSGINAAEFAVSGATFPLTINPDNSAPITVTFTPASPGFRAASLVVTSMAVDSPAQIPLSGYGVSSLPPTGTLQTWGYNGYGQLGTGNNVSSSVPTNTVGLPGPVVAAAFDSNFSVALLPNGTVWAWGDNNDGELGNGTYGGTNSTPAQVSNLSGVIAINDISGYHHPLAIRSDGTVWAWGNGGGYGLGNGQAFSNIPVQVFNADFTPFTGAVKVASNNYTNLILKSDGTLWAWGDNSYGLFGNDTINSAYFPVQINSNIKSMAAGLFFSLFLKNDGTVWASGLNTNGQLGNGTNTNTSTPIQLSGLSNIIAVSAGNDFGLALKNDGTVWSWGHNNLGQLGNGTITDSNLPVQVNNLRGVNDIGTGVDAAYAVKADGTLWAWGNNNYGQLGNGNNSQPGCTCQVAPARVSNISQSIGVSGGNLFGATINGSITSPIFNFGDASLDFGNQILNQTSAARTITITNSGNSSLVISSTAISGPNAAEFTITGPSFPITIAPGNSSPVTITFKPTSLAIRLATLVVTSTAVDSPHQLPLSGFGVNNLPATGSVQALGLQCLWAAWHGELYPESHSHHYR